MAVTQTPKEKGQAFLADVLAHLPAEKQAEVKAAFEASEKAVEAMGTGALRQSDYSKNMDEARGKLLEANGFKAQLDEWYLANEPKLVEYETLKAATGTPAVPATPATPATVGLTQKQLDEALAAASAQAFSAIIHTNELSARHLNTFKEVLDIQALMKDPEIGKIGLLGAYEKAYKPRYEEIAKQADAARIKTLVDAALVEERKKIASHPYPVSGREPSPLDRLENPVAAKPGDAPAIPVNVVDAAVEQYNQLQAARLGLGAPV